MWKGGGLVFLVCQSGLFADSLKGESSGCARDTGEKERVSILKVKG